MGEEQAVDGAMCVESAMLEWGPSPPRGRRDDFSAPAMSRVEAEAAAAYVQSRPVFLRHFRAEWNGKAQFEATWPEMLRDAHLVRRFRPTAARAGTYEIRCCVTRMRCQPSLTLSDASPPAFLFVASGFDTGSNAQVIFGATADPAGAQDLLLYTRGRVFDKCSRPLDFVSRPSIRWVLPCASAAEADEWLNAVELWLPLPGEPCLREGFGLTNWALRDVWLAAGGPKADERKRGSGALEAAVSQLCHSLGRPAWAMRRRAIAVEMEGGSTLPADVCGLAVAFLGVMEVWQDFGDTSRQLFRLHGNPHIDFAATRGSADGEVHTTCRQPCGEDYFHL